MAYDATRAQTILFCNPPSTWRWASPRPATLDPFGTTCNGSLGPVRLAFAPWSMPWAGDRFSLSLSPLPLNGAEVLLIGASRSRWGTIPLPLDLTPIGMTGCALHTAPTLWLPMVRAGGVASASLDVPAEGSLVGAHVYLQGLGTDATANAVGLVTTQGCDARIGAR
jgi:hypothetical protein